VDSTNRSFSVVICAYTEARWNQLCEAVDSVHDQTKPPVQVVIVIDHNPQLYERSLKRFSADVVVENSGVQGLSDARNTGVEHTVGDFVAFLDDDAAADSRWLEKLAEGYADSAVLGVGGHIDPIWEDARPGWFPEEFDWVAGCTYRGAPTERTPVRNMIGANMSFRRSTLIDAGGFRHQMGRTATMPLGDEETELCIRIRQKHGGVIMYEPSALVRHHVPSSRGTWAYFMPRCYAEGISKGVMSHMVGTRDGLSSERRHVLVVLPSGVIRGVGATFTGDLWGVPRAATIVVGLGATVLGYTVARTRGYFFPRPS